jgi:hypothetical protein
VDDGQQNADRSRGLKIANRETVVLENRPSELRREPCEQLDAPATRTRRIVPFRSTVPIHGFKKRRWWHPRFDQHEHVNVVTLNQIDDQRQQILPVDVPEEE